MNRMVSTSLAAVIIPSVNVAEADESSSLVEPGAKVKKLASGMKSTEGPVWLANEKKLVFSDIPNSKLMQWSENDGLSAFRNSEKATGNILDLQGRIVACQHGARNVIRIETDGSSTPGKLVTRRRYRRCSLLPRRYRVAFPPETIVRLDPCSPRAAFRLRPATSSAQRISDATS